MGRLKQKGNAGAARAYVTRSAAIKKLQCTLADFRRLCILKGIFPREPRHRKKANKGSSAPTSFYYAKDIAYLAHEPVLRKLREHKAFAKRLSKALGREEWSRAKSLEENKPVYTLDHIVKERYPTFIDALRDIDDPLCLIAVFANLPSNPRISTSLIENCTRLFDEWQLYIMHSKSLRKVFLSIKGVYYQAEVMGQTITWLVPYMFTQNIPVDVDVRVMLTFLEFYQTLLGFVFFKLYTDLGLVYPPPLDDVKRDSAAGFGAYTLQEAALTPKTNGATRRDVIDAEGKKVSGKDVRKTIEAIDAARGEEAMDNDETSPVAEGDPLALVEEEEFVPQPSASDPNVEVLPTLKSLTDLPSTVKTDLFASFTFFLSRETPRPILEFIIRAFGGRVGWTPSQGGGSPVKEDDDAITHVIVDRPPQMPTADNEQDQITSAEKEQGRDVARERRRRRKYVQPQWVVDCVNKGKVLLEEPYEQGKTLPPHLSPFGEPEGAYDPEEITDGGEQEKESVEGEETDGGDIDVPDADETGTLRAAELQAEAAGMDYGSFAKTAKKQLKANTAVTKEVDHGKDMGRMMLSKKKRKLYDKMKYTEEKKALERETLRRRKETLKRERIRKKDASSIA